MSAHPPPEVAEWLVVLGADGVVESVEGGAPITWMGHPLVDAPGTAGVLRQAAAGLVLAPPTSNVRRRMVHCVEGTKKVQVEVLLVEALPLRRAHTRVHELVMRTLDLFASQAKSNNIDLTIEQAGGVPPAIVLDSEKIAWALSTLVANALRYARTHVGVHVGWDDSSSGLVVEVSDDGPGIPEHQRRWLFERNPTTGQSAGLALLMVRDVMAAHRGSVVVESQAGRGTTFTLRIPRVRAA
jgi:signal transduction histidine kinase